MNFFVSTSVRFAAIVFFMWCSFLYAVPAAAVSISPLRQTIVVAQDSAATVRVQVENDTNSERQYTPEIDAFIIDKETGAAQFGAEDEALQWIRTDRRSFSLEAGQTAEISFTIQVPEGIVPRSHYLGLFVKEEPGVGQIGVGARVGSLLFMHMDGEVVEDLTREIFETKKNVYAQSPVDVSLNLTNHGTIHVVPRGRIVVQNMWGHVVETYPINQDARKILPDGQWSELYVLEKLRWFDIGRIGLRAEMVYGLQQRQLLDITSFWYVPLPSVLVILVVIIGGGALWLFRKKRSA